VNRAPPWRAIPFAAGPPFSGGDPGRGAPVLVSSAFCIALIDHVLAAETWGSEPLTMGDALAELLADITEAARTIGTILQAGRQRTTPADGDGPMMANQTRRREDVASRRADVWPWEDDCALEQD
jgi:hypothetical protein